MSKRKIIISLALLALVFSFSSCSLSKKTVSPVGPNKPGDTKPEPTDDPTAISGIKKFASIDELRTFFEENQASSGGSRGMGFGSTGVMEKAMPMADMAQTNSLGVEESSGNASAVAGTPDFSKTNVQVEGVDEDDLIKTDGTYIYAVAGKSIVITKAFPANTAEVVAEIKLKDYPQSLYLYKDKLVVIGQNEGINTMPVYQSFRRHNQYSFLKVFDLTDKKNPKQVRDLDFEGSYTNSRMIGEYVYYFTNSYFPYYDDEIPYPRILENGEEISTDPKSAKCNCPDIYYFDIPYNSFNYTTVTAVNVINGDEKLASDAYLMDYGQNLYVSQNNLFITYTKYVDELQLSLDILKELVVPELSAKDKDRIAKIDATDKAVLTTYEKNNKINEVINRYRERLTEEEQRALEKKIREKLSAKYEDISKELEKTVIHKVAIDKANLDYKGTAEVTGHVLNQFSMDEQGGYFRIATTKGRTWSMYFSDSDKAGVERESYNNLYVLDENLKTVGSLEKLAVGEQIYSVRFMQNRAYMVTFKQTDPLFVIDLADPKNPKVLGKLKIPGFSSYLHPYDDTTLIGIGKETTETESGGVRTKGLKISLFDVSDVANPKEAGKYEMGDAGSDSIALNDHKAFLFSREKNLLSIPVTLMEDTTGRGWGRFAFSGAVVLKITKDSIEQLGRIDHSDGGVASNREDWYWGGYGYYDNTVKRSLFIEDNLYTYSSKYLKINDLKNDLKELGKLRLKKGASAGDDYEVVN